jgi:hypothetical protein
MRRPFAGTAYHRSGFMSGGTHSSTIDNSKTQRQIHLLMLAWNGVSFDEPFLRDTVNIPYWDRKRVVNPRVKLRMDFRDPDTVGTFPFHCHLLEHEDAAWRAPSVFCLAPTRSQPPLMQINQAILRCLPFVSARSDIWRDILLPSFYCVRCLITLYVLFFSPSSGCSNYISMNRYRYPFVFVRICRFTFRSA